MILCSNAGSASNFSTAQPANARGVCGRWALILELILPYTGENPSPQLDVEEIPDMTRNGLS